LRTGEQLEMVPIGTLRKRRHDEQAKLSEAEKERLNDERIEQAHERAERKRLDIRFWCENKFEARFTDGAETAAAEIAVHRAFLKACGDVPDVIEGESLRRLAKRTLMRLCKNGGYGTGRDTWVEGFSWVKKQYMFEGFLIHNMTEDYFETHWIPPADTSEMEADLPIDVNALESWPNFGRVDVPEKKTKPVLAPPPVPVFQAPDFRLSLGDSTRDTHLEQQARDYLNNGTD